MTGKNAFFHATVADFAKKVGYIYDGRIKSKLKGEENPR